MRSPSRATLARDRVRAVSAMLAVLAAGAIARLWHWREVFPDGAVRLAFDTDSDYHVLQAERFLRSGLGSLWFDPSLNWPVGAVVPWPPLFDVLVAGAARAAFGAAVTRPQIAAAAAVLPVVLGLATLLVVAGLGRVLLGRGGGSGAALVVALLLGHILTSVLGRADQHVLEVLLAGAILLCFTLGWKAATPGRRGFAIAALGIFVALSFWNWMGSALNLVLPVAFTAAAYAFLDEADPAVRRIPGVQAWGFGIAAAVLGISIAALGPPGALQRGSLLGISALHVTVTACAAAFGALLLAARRLRVRRGPAPPWLRVAEVAVAALAPATLAMLLIPAVREGVRTGLTALTASNPWYASISEFQHLLFSCQFPLWTDVKVAVSFLGFLVPAAFAAVPSLVRRWRQGERASVTFLAGWGALYLVLVLLRRRFAPYAIVPLALLGAEGIRFWSRAVAERLRLSEAPRIAIAATAMAIVVLPSARNIPNVFMANVPDATASALAWLGSQRASEGREGVLSSWGLGHAVAFHAGKPVIATPFGTEGGDGALLDTARFGFERDPEAAEAMLLRRRVGWVVLQDPRPDAFMDGTLAAPGNQIALQACNFRQGVVFSYERSYVDLMFPRLYLFDGLSAPDRRVLPVPWARLLRESALENGVKIFGVVPGTFVGVTGVAPGELVEAWTTLVTNLGRRIEWRTGAFANGEGAVELRVPYATGLNGAVAASAWTIASGGASTTLEVAESAVTGGARVWVHFGGASASVGRGDPG